MTDKLVDLIVELNEKQALSKAKEMLEAGFNPMNVLNECSEAMEIVGKRFEDEIYFLPDLMMSGAILTQISEIVKPYMEKGQAETKKYKGIVVLGTVEGDLHDIGKNIVKFLLETNGFKVFDLGIDVPPQQFVKAIKDHSPIIVGLSALLTSAFDSMKYTVEAIEQAGLREQVKIIIGGGPVDGIIARYANADAYAKNAQEGVRFAQKCVM